MRVGVKQHAHTPTMSIIIAGSMEGLFDANHTKDARVHTESHAGVSVRRWNCRPLRCESSFCCATLALTIGAFQGACLRVAVKLHAHTPMTPIIVADGTVGSSLRFTIKSRACTPIRIRVSMIPDGVAGHCSASRHKVASCWLAHPMEL